MPGYGCRKRRQGKDSEARVKSRRCQREKKMEMWKSPAKLHKRRRQGVDIAE
ncbi:hypothetical protein HPP92_018842 [Vanilla planifolia]|uniref:Uncharacterized protein n=1 Tax=Vanilla planifolia TaxID=51239 RepID=A0A835QGE2_VANPL|nr:hypothetical protein HPP92_018842 [Vanilla planifolia]